MSPDGGSSLRMRSGAPDLGSLEAQLGDLLFEGEIARTSRAVIHRIRARRRSDRPLALKVALAPVDEEDLARFQHEVRLLSEVRHGNVIEVYDYGVLPGNFPYLVMELLEGLDPFESLRRSDWQVVYDLAIQAAAGLAHIHRHGIVHLDVKPRNLGLWKEDGQLRLKILDFGLAQAIRGQLDRRIRGTLAYAAPEILLQDRFDHRADLYSLGMTLFQLTTGVLPSAGDDMAAIRYHLQGTAPDPLAYRADMPVALAAIVRRLLQRDPERRFPSAGQLLTELANAAGRSLDTGALALGSGSILAARLVAREETVAALLEHLAAAAAGAGRVVFVEGGDGIGKSRLLRELRLKAAMRGARVGYGRALAVRSDLLRPLRSALGHLGLELEPGLHEPAVVAERLTRLAESQGTLALLLDELQAGDTALLDWLLALQRRLAKAPVLVVAACRSLGEGREEAAKHVIQLAPLDAASTRQLVDASFGTEELPAVLYDWVATHAAGLPGRIELLLRHLVDERIMVFRHGEWKPSLSALARLPQRPEGFEAIELEAVEALPGAERRVLEAAALVGEPARWKTLCEVLEEIPAQDVWDALSRLVDRGLVARASDVDGDAYVVSQTHLAPLILERVPGERRRELHRRFGDVLSQRVEAGEADLVRAAAEHYGRAGEHERALPMLRRAAAQASEQGRFGVAADLCARAAEVAAELGRHELVPAIRLEQALAHERAGALRRALRQLEALVAAGDGAKRRRAEDRIERARLLARVADLTGRLGELGRAEDALVAARETLGTLEAPEIEAELARLEAEALAPRSPTEAFRVAREALKRATARGLVEPRIGLVSTLAEIFLIRREWRRASRLLQRAERAVAESGPNRFATRIRIQVARALAGQREVAGARGVLTGVARQCEQGGDAAGELLALHHLALLECGVGEWRAAREPLLQSFELRRRLDIRAAETEAALARAAIEEMLGDWAAARRHFQRLARPEGEVTPAVVTARAHLAALARKRGDWVDAEALGQEALADAERLGDRGLLALAHYHLGLIEKARERWAPAAAHLQRALELTDSAGYLERVARIRNSLADLALRRDLLEEAAAHVDAALVASRAWANRFEHAKATASAARLAMRRHDAARGEELFAEALGVLEQLETPFEYGVVLYEWGVRTSSPQIAVERLDRALVAFDRLGAATEYERTRGVIDGIRERARVQGGRRGPPGLWEVARIINTTLDLDDVLERTMDLVLERLRAERGMIVLFRPLTGEIEVSAVRNLGKGPEEESRRLSETVVRRVIETGQPVLSVDAFTDSRFSGAESIVASHIVSILCVPLVIRDQPAGAIYLDHRSQRLFTENDLEFLLAFADQAAVAIHNARLYGDLEAARERLRAENESLKREVLSTRSLTNLIGRSRAIQELKATLERVAQSPSTVLVRGESGTGKGLVARTLHYLSPRREMPFVQFNCAALPETLVESELFGHEKGAFTGAMALKPGRFELAHKGTIFLDEIGKVSMSVQSKLLRVVEDKEFERVGGTRTQKVDTRIVTATNLNLEEAIAKDEFREDLYYRLNIIPIVLPPLRERKEDIPYLVEHFVTKISRDLGQEPKEIEPGVLDLFLAYRWSGNVRELEATIHRALVLTAGERLRPDDFSWLGVDPKTLPPPRRETNGTAPAAATPTIDPNRYQELIDDYDRELVKAALATSGGRIRECARVLGIARNTLKAKIRKWGIEAGDD